MNLKSISKYQLLILFLLISQSYIFANANDDDDDEGNVFAKKKKPPPKVSNTGDEAIQAIREYIDLLTANWNGFFNSLGSNTPHTTQVLITYLRQVSAAYARVLQLHDYNGDAVSRAIRSQFMQYIIPRMRDVTHFNIDSPIINGPAVVQYSAREQRMVTDERLRQQRWSHPSNDRPRPSQPIDRIVPYGELEHIIFLRVPFPEPPPADRPFRPWGDSWHKVINPESWMGLDMHRDITWNHLVPYAEVRYLFESYNRLWLRNNHGNVWYSQAMLIWLEIRLSILVILRADLAMGIPDAAEILRNHEYYTERGMAWNVWSAGNLFIGPRDDARLPAPSKHGPERFEIQAAKVFRSERWALEGYRLTRDIQKFKKIPWNKQTLRELLNLYYRYVRLLQESGSDQLWVDTQQGVAPANVSYYDVHERQLSPQVQEHFERAVSEDIRRHERRNIVSREYHRLRQSGVPEPVVHSIIDKELKKGGKLYNQLEEIRKDKLKKKIDNYFKQLKVSRYIFSGPRESSNWTFMQETSKCVGKKLKLDIEICDRNVLFDPNTPSTSSGSTGSGSGSSDGFFDFSFVKLVEHDSGVESENENDEFCGATGDHRNMLIDPSIVTNPPPDLSSPNESIDIDEDFYEDTEESLQDAALNSCLKNPKRQRRYKRDSTNCSMEIVKNAWNQCKKETKVKKAVKVDKVQKPIHDEFLVGYKN